jgi:hypothetical protein
MKNTFENYQACYNTEGAILKRRPIDCWISGLTHPKFISKYVFMRIHITGSIGTNGQMNPATEAAATCVMPSKFSKRI